MKKLLGLFVAVLVSVGLTGGIVAANSGAIDGTGPGSRNEISDKDNSRVNLNNRTDVDARIDTDQYASSGDAWVKFNTTGGSASSGDASNENSVEADLSIDNSGSSSAALACACNGGGGGNSSSIDNTGPLSKNEIKHENNSRVEVNNKTDVNFNNNVKQVAKTGNTAVFLNTTGGDATSGDASNSSSTVFSLSVTN